MDQKFDDKKPQRPTSRLISSFEDSSAGEGGFTSERTIPGDYSSLTEHTEHDALGHAYAGSLADLIDPSLDGQTVDSEFPDFTATDLQALAHADPMEQRAYEDLHRLIVDCIDVIDSLGRAVDAARERALDADAATDMELVHARLLDTLGAHGVREESGADSHFDPEFHDMVGERPVDEPERDGLVLETQATGYSRNGHPLRRARVIVGKKR